MRKPELVVNSKCVLDNEITTPRGNAVYVKESRDECSLEITN